MESNSAQKNPCNTCMVCGKSGPRRLFSVIDTNENVPGEWDILKCDSCGTAVLSPFPDPDEIAAFYQNTFYTPDGKRFRGWMEILRRGFANLRGSILNTLLPAKGKLIDFGSGAGHFALAQERNGWEVVSVDPYSSASKGAGCRPRRDGTFQLLYPDNHFDAVTAWYVIEHLRDPRAAITEFCRVLKPGGILLLAQQDFASIQARFFGPNWLYLDPPRHLWQFSLKSIIQLAQEQPLKAVKTSHASIEMSPYCMVQSTLNMLLGNHNDLFYFLKNRGLSNDSGSRSSLSRRGVRIFSSLILLPILAPIVLLAYLLLLLFKSGDVVEIYFRKC